MVILKHILAQLIDVFFFVFFYLFDKVQLIVLLGKQGKHTQKAHRSVSVRLCLNYEL